MEDTIVAISTALGVGAISIIRLSGKDAIEIVNNCFKGKDLTKVNSHTINYGFIKNNNEIVDEVLVSVMRAPKTFTTEDIVEINCHGGIIPTKQILETMLQHGARLAEPGEFTKRAFLNGRIDLVESEAVMDLIESKSAEAKKMALSQLKGSLSKLIEEFRDSLKQLLSSIEVNIDYPEYYDIEVITKTKIKEEITKIKEEIMDLPSKIESILDEKETLKEFASNIYTEHDIYFLGRGVDYTTALEASLKLKEISYIHSDAYASGELKHGPIALIEKGVTVIGIITDENLVEKSMNNVLEVITRGAKTFIITNKLLKKNNFNYVLNIPDTSSILSPILSIISLQLLSYYVAKYKGLDVDKPRNLAKSVTVE